MKDGPWLVLAMYALAVLLLGLLAFAWIFPLVVESGRAVRRMIPWLRGSLCFWCGAVVFSALIGIWADSYRMMSQVSSSQPGTDRYWSVSLLRGHVIGYSLEEEIESIPTGPREISFHREAAGLLGEMRGLDWRRMTDLEKAQTADGSWQVTLRQYTSQGPFVAVVVVFVLVWGLCLVVASKLEKKEETKEWKGSSDA